MTDGSSQRVYCCKWEDRNKLIDLLFNQDVVPRVVSVTVSPYGPVFVAYPMHAGCWTHAVVTAQLAGYDELPPGLTSGSSSSPAGPPSEPR